MTGENRQQKILEEAFKKIKKDADKIWDLVDQEIENETAIFNLQGKPAIYKNTIVLLQGKTGTHKSRLAGSLVSLLVSDDRSLELLGFSKVTDNDLLVIYADTERNISNQLPIALKQIKRDSKVELSKLKERLIIFPLMNSARRIRTTLLGKQFIELRKGKEGGFKTTVIIFLDIVSDLVGDFNNVIDTLELTDIINNAINTFDITFILTIHENPGMGEKARGHLGTELGNKASTIFQMASTTQKEVYSLKMVKSRSTLKYDDVFLQFDPLLNNLAVVSDLNTIRQITNPDPIKVCKALGEMFFDKKERLELIELLKKAVEWKTRKIEEVLKFVVENSLQFETSLGRTILTKSRGKKVEYHMKFLDLPDSKPPIKNEETEHV